MNIPQKKLLQNILDSVSKTKNRMGSIDQKVGDFYASGMDTATINKRGYQPIKQTLGPYQCHHECASAPEICGG
jgi:putative endopeptidase